MIQYPGAILVTEPKNALTYCHVPKIASTSWMLTTADMNPITSDEVEKLYQSRSLHDRMLSKFSFIIKTHKDILKLHNSSLYKFVFIRHPFERLASAFHDKFIFWKQDNLMQPFVDYYLHLKGIPKPTGIGRDWINKMIDVSFTNFANFVLHEASLLQKTSGPSGHWWPFTDMCKLCVIEYDYVGKIETLQEDVDCVLNTFPTYELLQKNEHKG